MNDLTTSNNWVLTPEQYASMSPREKEVRSGYVNGLLLGDIALATGISRDLVTHTACLLRHRGIPVPRAIKSRYLNEPVMYHVTGTRANGVRRTCHSQVWEDAVAGVVKDGGVIDG